MCLLTDYLCQRAPAIPYAAIPLFGKQLPAQDVMRFFAAIALLASLALSTHAKTLNWSRLSDSYVPFAEMAVTAEHGAFMANFETVSHSDTGAVWKDIGGYKTKAELTNIAAHPSSAQVLAIGDIPRPCLGNRRNSNDDEAAALVLVDLRSGSEARPVPGVGDIRPLAVKPVLFVGSTDDSAAAFGVLARSSKGYSIFTVSDYGANVTRTDITLPGLPVGVVPVQAAFPSLSTWFVVTAPEPAAAANSAMRRGSCITTSTAVRSAALARARANGVSGAIYRSSDAGQTWEQVHTEDAAAYTDIDCASEEACLASVVLDNANAQIHRLNKGAWTAPYRQGSASIFSVRYAQDAPEQLAVASGSVLSEDGRQIGFLVSSTHNGLRWEADIRDSVVDAFVGAVALLKGPGGRPFALAAGLQQSHLVVYGAL
jgi:hypothetical protein